MTWILLACVAALFKSLATISEKELLIDESPSEYISGISFIIAIFSLPLLYIVKDMSITSESLWFTYGLSILSVVDALAIAYVVKKLDISESGALLATTPIIVALFGTVFINELLTTSQIAGIILSSFGLFILEFKHRNKKGQEIDPTDHIDNGVSHSRKKLYTILVIGLLVFGLTTIGDRYMIHYRGVDPILFLLIIQVFISLNMFAVDIIRNAFRAPTERRNKLIDPKLLTQKSFWANVVFIIAHRVTHMFATNLVAAGLLNAVKQINAVITTVLGGKLFKEKELFRRTIACLVILLGAVLVIL
jgi:drug/metabolite transporter (DMT)-like permease